MDSIRDQRSKAKKAVSIKARHVTSGTGVVEPAKLLELVCALDDAYLDFLDINEEFKALCLREAAAPEETVVNGLTIEQYEADVLATVTTAKGLYRASGIPATQSTEPRQQVATSASPFFKKRHIMKFSGQRKDWPDFRRYWQELALPLIGANDMQRASELKEACKGGTAYPEIENISLGASDAHSLMWKALCDSYDNVVLAVSSAMDDLKGLKCIREGDFRGTVNLIRKVESVYLQLDVLGQVDFVSNREVSTIVNNLPPLLTREWAEKHLQLSPAIQLRPFRELYTFLKAKMPMLKYLSDSKDLSSASSGNTTIPSSRKSSHAVSVPKDRFSLSSTLNECDLHPGAKHKLIVCKKFLAMSVKERKETITSSKRCFRCLSPLHMIGKCDQKEGCEKCKRGSHHTLLCFSLPAVTNTNNSSSHPQESHAMPVGNHATQGGGSTLYAIYEVKIPHNKGSAIVFCDDGSEVSFISEDAVKRLKPKPLKTTEIEMVTLSNTKRLSTRLWEVNLTTTSGKKVPVVCYEVPALTGEVAQLVADKIAAIFPSYDPHVLTRPAGKVDILLGADYFSLHPKQELASDGKNLSVMRGELGLCLQGAHPNLVESTDSSSFMGSCVRVITNFVSCPAHTDSFLQGEELGTLVNPQCGACKCGKCPLVGHHFSFREEQELRQIRANLKYDSQGEYWVSSYPWIADPSLLPNNYHAVLATLRNTEKRLSLEPSWREKYSSQIQDMADRGVARKLSRSEVESWDGPVYYLSHLAVENPKSNTTPVRIVFNSSQQFKGVSLNSFLAKGPDTFKANLLGILLRFRENPVVLIGDISKMYNSVHLESLEQHTHRFLWRDFEDRPPDIWAITRVNMGDKPAGAIAVEAKDMTAERFSEVSPAAAAIITQSTYVDDIVDSVSSLQEARQLSADVELILKKGGFFIKEWKFGGVGVGPPSEVLNVLGIKWDPSTDCITFGVQLNFSKKKRGIRTSPNLHHSQVPAHLPVSLTRRMVLEQVMGVYDPLGLLSPFLLIAKVYLRETWELQLGWDDPLPPTLDEKWRHFFVDLFQIENLQFPRCLRPAAAVGDPQLIILSDGSELAYGCAAYVRWELPDGSFSCRLIMSKCRIAPINRISIPQMELNGAVLSKRVRKVIEDESRFRFSKVYQLIDSETVLSMLHKVSTRFKVYEGVRIGEIQAATGGNLEAWGWIPGKCNIADWVTRQHCPLDLGPDSEWYRGPKFLYTPFSEWQVSFNPSKLSNLPGEKKVIKCNNVEVSSTLALSYSRCSSLSTIEWALARVLCALRSRSFKGGKRSNVTPSVLTEVGIQLIKDMQADWSEAEVKGRFRTLMPVLSEGIWVVGTRISHKSPLTPDNRPQILLLPHHPLTRHLMKQAHEMSGHKGRDATLARFRAKYWTSHASKLSKSVCDSCQMCKRIKAKTLSQVMGPMPAARLSPSPPFSSTMVDLFGPISVRGEIQKRTTGKAWGVVFADLCSRAVHIEVTCGYDAQSFLLALQRFTSVRGWPVEFFSDPGTQLKASAEIIAKSTDHGTTWHFSPADSPWRQGTVEALIKSVKRAFMLSVKNQRLSIPELLTALTNIANTLNERPIGYFPGTDSTLSILTPNSLLLGRSFAANPGGYDIESQSLYSRLALIKGVQSQFWKQWTQLYAPTLVSQSKWKASTPNLKLGDVVLILEDALSLSKGHYRLARVVEATPGLDGNVRKVKVAYKNFRVGEKIMEYSGTPDTIVERAVQRLVLIDSVESDL